tara:strand:+ start:1896 stop:2111 length:216 start_codon:yes stop_codon:yes gene_type:complete
VWIGKKHTEAGDIGSVEIIFKHLAVFVLSDQRFVAIRKNKNGEDDPGRGRPFFSKNDGALCRDRENKLWEA